MLYKNTDNLALFYRKRYYFIENATVLHADIKIATDWLVGRYLLLYYELLITLQQMRSDKLPIYIHLDPTAPATRLQV